MRRPSSSWSWSLATHNPGSTRVSVRLSKDKRSGPGRSSVVPVGVRSLSKTIARFWRSRVGSPLMSRNRVPCVTGSMTITNCAGNCSESNAFPPGGSSTELEHDFLEQILEIIRHVDARAPEHLTKILVERQFVGVVRRDPAHPPADREGHLNDFVEGRRIPRRAPGAGILVLVDALQCRARSSTPPQPGHKTFHDSSNIPSRAACRKAAITRSSSSPVSPRNPAH